MTVEVFWQSNPKDIEVYKKAYQLKQKAHDEELWRMGIYVGRSLSTVLDSMLNGKNAKADYPEKPFLYEEEKRELSEEEIKRKREAFVAMLKVMEINFNNSHKKE